MLIGGYKCQTAWMTAGSGSARWCVAERDGQRFFIKQFLTPVQPSPTAARNETLYRKQLARCMAFERKKRTLYASLRCVIGDCVTPITDFFSFENRYYAVSEYIPTPFDTLETLGKVSARVARELLYALALCLGRLHAQGIVHADLKPEHILILREGDALRVRLIDFDSGFLEDDPPLQAREIEGDPVFLAPETYRCMAGESGTLNRRLDTFAFGAIAHLLLAGTMPDVQSVGHTYLYEAALADTVIPISTALPAVYHWLIRKALAKDPADRPDDAMLERLLATPKDAQHAPTAVETPMKSFFKVDGWRL